MQVCTCLQVLFMDTNGHITRLGIYLPTYNLMMNIQMLDWLLG